MLKREGIRGPSASSVHFSHNIWLPFFYYPSLGNVGASLGQLEKLWLLVTLSCLLYGAAVVEVIVCYFCRQSRKSQTIEFPML